jgi:DNA-binding CsgD family transcriptional regulator/PAS domain-containing protein
MAEALTPQALSGLIGSIYDCALDPARWEETLVDLRQAFDTQVGMLALADRRRNRLLIHRTVGIEPRWLEELERHVSEINQCMEVFGAQLSPDEPFVMSRQIPLAYSSTSPYIQNCLRPQGIVDIMQHYLLDTSTRYSVFAVSKNEKQGRITQREIELGGLLLPHLRRAVTISNALDVRTIERARLAQTLDALRCAVLLTREDSAIVHANAAAENLLRDGELVQGTGGILRASSASATAELRAAIAHAAQDETRIGKAGLAILLTQADQEPVFAHVLPLTGGDLRTRLNPEAVAAVFIGATGEQEGASTIAAVFGLTPAETRVLASLLAGRTLGDTAGALGIASSTAKSHLDAIFAKTGVTRQADLVRLGTGPVPPTKLGANVRRVSEN